MVGQTISHYKIVEKIGEGGMGEVYLAQDTSLDCEVALKFLSDSLQADPTAKKRFLREAKSAAAINHPFICNIHEVGEEDGQSFIAMEYVQGETLRAKLAEGPLTLKEALEKITEIAEALEAAHKHNILHRDVKPSNVMVTPEGHVKVMDFGLAKRIVPAEGAGSQEQTLTGLTKTGFTVGTPAYMSPEQLRDQKVDTRADIFSLGVVLYEMLTGAHPFLKAQAMETGSAILNEEPAPLSQHIHPAPPLLQHIVRKMLAKEPDERYQLMHDVRTDLRAVMDEIGEVLAEPGIVSPAKAISTTQPSRWKVAIPWSIVVVMAVAGIAIWTLTGPEPRLLTEFVIATPSNASLIDTPSRDLAISPDGRHIVYSGQAEGSQLFLRSLDDVALTPLSGTEDATGPFVSPDGESVGFFATGKLKKVSLRGGAAITLCDAGGANRSGSWDSEGVIVFSDARSLYRVPAGGGTPKILASPDPDRGEFAYLTPQVLPGGKAILFTVALGVVGNQIAVLSPDRIEKKILLEGGESAHYTSTGHLVYALPGSGTLMAVEFDSSTLEVLGDPAPVLEGVRNSLISAADYAISDNGNLVDVPVGQSIERSLVWVNRDGTEQLVTEERRNFTLPRVAPDGRRLAVAITGDDQIRNIWIYDIERRSFSRLTFEGNHGPLIWTPDSQWITFQSNRDGAPNLYRKPADGSGKAERLTTSPFPQSPDSWSPDGSVLVFRESRPETSHDIWILPMEGDRKPELLISSSQRDCCARFSPDGQWLAYVSSETGQHHVYVSPYPEPSVKWLVSGEEGGGGPVWSPDGTELFYRSGNRKMMVVSVQTQPTFSAGTPRELFEGAYSTSVTLPGVSQYHDIYPDGQRFLMIKEEQGANQIHVVLNWFEELKSLVPTD